MAAEQPVIKVDTASDEVRATQVFDGPDAKAGPDSMGADKQDVRPAEAREPEKPLSELQAILAEQTKVPTIEQLAPTNNEELVATANPLAERTVLGKPDVVAANEQPQVNQNHDSPSIAQQEAATLASGRENGDEQDEIDSAGQDGVELSNIEIAAPAGLLQPDKEKLEPAQDDAADLPDQLDEADTIITTVDLPTQNQEIPPIAAMEPVEPQQLAEVFIAVDTSEGTPLEPLGQKQALDQIQEQLLEIPDEPLREAKLEIAKEIRAVTEFVHQLEADILQEIAVLQEAVPEEFAVLLDKEIAPSALRILAVLDAVPEVALLPQLIELREQLRSQIQLLEEKTQQLLQGLAIIYDKEAQSYKIFDAADPMHEKQSSLPHMVGSMADDITSGLHALVARTALGRLDLLFAA